MDRFYYIILFLFCFFLNLACFGTQAKLRFFPEDSVLLRTDVGKSEISGFFLHNDGETRVQIKEIFIEGPSAEYFQIYENGCQNRKRPSASYENNEVCYLLIDFVPTLPSGGLEGFIAYLKIDYMDFEGKAQQIRATLIGYAYPNH